MTASSQRDGHNASNARLNKELLSKSSSGKYIWGGWCTDKMDIHQYLQVTLRLFRNPLYAFKWAVYFILLISNELKQSGRRRQQERQHNNFSWFLHVHHAFLYISLPSLHDYDVFWRTWTYKTTIFFFYCELRYSPLEFNSWKNCQYLTNSKSWNKNDEVWNSANSFLRWRFSRCFRRRCLSSLLLVTHPYSLFNLRNCC